MASCIICQTEISVVIGGYEEMQHIESLRLLVDLVEVPNKFYYHFQRFPASLVFTLSYGQHLDDDGKDLADVKQVFTRFVRDVNPAAHLVDTFPILDLLPDFLSPYARFMIIKPVDLIRAPGGGQKQNRSTNTNLR